MANDYFGFFNDGFPVVIGHLPGFASVLIAQKPNQATMMRRDVQHPHGLWNRCF